MEIENPKNAEFVPLLGASNFERKSMAALGIPDEFSFRMDWTKGGEGHEVLRAYPVQNSHSSEAAGQAIPGDTQV